MNRPLSAAEAAQAKELAGRIEEEATDLLEPMARTMMVMGWPAEFQRIMWETVAMKAQLLADAAGHG